MATAYQMLAIPISLPTAEKGWFILRNELCSAPLSAEYPSLAEYSDLPAGWKGWKSQSGSAAGISIKSDRSGTTVRLTETFGYLWKITGIPQEVCLSSSLESRDQAQWSLIEPDIGRFRIINFLGLANIRITDGTSGLLSLQLEFISGKLDFDSEYRSMTEDIASFCQQLLLSWNAPTSLKFSTDPARQANLLLEQFIFLRHFLTPERLSYLIEAIGRNPHVSLVRESNWTPVSMVRSNDHLSSPAKMLKSWHRDGSGRLRPGEALNILKRETHDTAPNRFIKFALASFRRICALVAETGNGTFPSSLATEAKELLGHLDTLLARRFFNEVGKMQRLPLDNQTLQKREGYREVLNTWLLSQAAATLDWPGQRDAYNGPSRNVAKLYEYWIFLELHKILKSAPGVRSCESGQTSDRRFLTLSSGEMTINLKSGRHSVSSFIYTGPSGRELKADLHYERMFSRVLPPAFGGSYSRQFRPDYTLSIYPARFSSEAAAEAQGMVSHLHFDAKYRAESIGELFGGAEDTEEAIPAEKDLGKTVSTYKRGDLLKMHTYNDALRNTIGSYVLYPGSDPENAEHMPEFHEIAPGVGAFVMKPGNPDCQKALSGFILDILRHQADNFSQYRHLADIRHRVHSSPPENIGEASGGHTAAFPAAPCILLRTEKAEDATLQQQSAVYCRMDAGSIAPDLLLSLNTGMEIIPWHISESGEARTNGWRARLISVSITGNSQLKELLRGTESPDLPQPADDLSQYLLIRLGSISGLAEINLGHLVPAPDPAVKLTCSTWQQILDRPPSAGTTGTA